MKIIMKKFLIINQEEISKYLSKEQILEYIGLLDKINDKALYKSKIHGIYHSQKVLLFAFIIATRLGLSDIDKIIIIYAAMYHDIGRINDRNETFHGLKSASEIDSLLCNDIKNNEEDLNIIKAIIENHSREDKYRDNTFQNYFDNSLIGTDLHNRYIQLDSILKDADALDRNRFIDGYQFGLDERYLRNDVAKQLVKFSKKLNIFYIDSVGEEFKEEFLDFSEGTGLHGVGLDFFKIPSILDSGILSHTQLEKHGIAGAVNFFGGNYRNWVSVVDNDLKDMKLTGYETFISKGIFFECECLKMASTKDEISSVLALEYGLPCNKSNHKDERFVHEKIEPQNIQSIKISEEMANKCICDCSFLYNCLEFEAFKEKIMHFIRYCEIDIDECNKEGLFSHIEKYRMELDNHHSKRFGNKNDNLHNLNINLNSILVNIDSIIAKFIAKHYAKKLGKNANEVTIKEAMLFEIENCLDKISYISGVDYNIEDGFIKIGLKKKDIKIKVNTF